MDIPARGLCKSQTYSSAVRAEQSLKVVIRRVPRSVGPLLAKYFDEGDLAFVESGGRANGFLFEFPHSTE